MEEDVIIIDDSGMQRNAVIVRRPGGAVDHRGGPPPPAWTRPWGGVGGGRKPYYPQPYVPAPQAPVVYQPPVAMTPATNTLKNWIPDIIDILAAISPLPAPPVATGDPAKDFANAMTYAGALAGSFKRADLMHSAARIIEKRL